MREPSKNTATDTAIEAALLDIARSIHKDDARYDTARLFFMEAKLAPEVYAYVGKRLATKGEGRGHRAWMARDKIIVAAVSFVALQFDLDELRNDATRDKGGNESACSIVHKALRQLGVAIAERTVEDIWKARPRARGVTIEPIVQP